MLKLLEWENPTFGEDQYITFAKVDTFNFRYELHRSLDKITVTRSFDIQPFAWETSEILAKERAQLDLMAKIESLYLGMPKVKQLEWHNGARNVWYAAQTNYVIMCNTDPKGLGDDLYIVKIPLMGVTTNPWGSLETAQRYVQVRHTQYIRSTLEYPT